MNRLAGIHAVREALLSGQPLDRIVIARGRHGERIEEIVRLARERGVPVRFEERAQLERLAAGGRHQGVVALAAAKEVADFEDLAARAASDSARHGLLLLLDGIEDPHNLGAILRSALAAGVHGVILPERRAAGLTDAVARAAAGALAHLPVARVKNLNRAMERLKEAGFWLIGLDERASQPHTSADYTGRVALVLGSEGAGLHELVRKNCDFLVAIPTSGPIRSLNVSVAAGIVLFEAVRQRRARSG
jgi:23S rRNA (guanosine2251-2'-O)-methyltransferase